MYVKICSIIGFITLIAFASCNNTEDNNSLLSQPPYDKLTDSITAAPQNADLYYHRGGLLYSNNQFQLSENDLLHAWTLQPKEEYALSIITLLKQKNTDSALQFIRTAIPVLPNSIALKVGEARGFQQKKLYDSAIVVCNAILERYPNQLDALLLKSDILKDLNRNAEALQLKEQAYKLAPLDRELAYDLAYDYAMAKNPNALQLTDTLIKKDNTENVAKAYYVKATYFNNINNDKEALKNYDSAIASNFNFLDAYLDKGQMLYNQNNLSAAEKNFQLALRVSPGTAAFYFWLAKTQQAEHKIQDASLNYQRAYGLDKTMKEAKDSADKLSAR